VAHHTITLRRTGVKGFLSNQSIGTDALNAMNNIPGVKNPEIIKEADEEVKINYEWIGDEKFWDTDTHLLKFGLKRVNLCTGN
jgi:hypothetical protein